MPKTAADVSLIVKALFKSNERFAIKAGGHNPNRHFSSVESGILINLRDLKEITYDAASSTVRIGPGNRWADVVKALELFNVTVVGGRIGSVGVGGYLLGSGGNMIFHSKKTDQILTAVRNFVEDCQDPRAAIIATNFLVLRAHVSFWAIFLFYDGPQPPPGTFDSFTEIGPMRETCRTTTYVKLLTKFDNFIFTGQSYSIATETSPLPDRKCGLKVMRSYYDSLDRIVMEFDMSNLRPSQASRVDAALVEIYAGIREKVQGFIADGTLPDAHLPLFMNDANYQQDYFGRLRPETLAFAKAVRDEVDPDGIFRERTGGFKM
ncbi:FAD-binding domain-containing protein [Mollisia scopiformis]|uniref:FAD-binding domain-containing protein n=1 Tax=Mollisia scopiformis TaxID=149040 RepID=A0A194XAN5_MOLSC|nr:FAD-binding domain-containing protein [Mollisia scopiformis]KUJ17209.1 FAD-binding domain-containing protein [Mollisia scopiformis]